VVFFEDEEPPVVLSISPMPPPTWLERSGGPVWNASFRHVAAPSGALALAMSALSLVVMLVVLLARTGMAYRPPSTSMQTWSYVLGLLPLLVFVWKSRLELRHWLMSTATTSIAVGDGMFQLCPRDSGAAVRCALTEIASMTLEPHDLTAKEYSVHLALQNGEHIRWGLGVANGHEAQFVFDRVAAMFDSGGRDLRVGYRGEQLRVAAEMALDVGTDAHAQEGLLENVEEGVAPLRPRVANQRELP
jgi:hypothetical protein